EVHGNCEVERGVRGGNAAERAGAGGDGQVQRAAGRGRRDAGGRGAAPQRQGGAHQLRRRQAHCGRRPVLGDEGTGGRLLAAGAEVARGGGGVAQACSLPRGAGGAAPGALGRGLRAERPHRRAARRRAAPAPDDRCPAL
ncbi:MAG: PhnB protein, partial [uncultured Chloroflexi bacterium]